MISESGGLPAIEFCETPDPEVPVSAFNIFRSPISESGDYWVRYECKSTCADWRACGVAAYSDDNGELLMNGRDPEQPKQAVAYVVDGMGGHLAFSADGDKTVIVHSGAGGTRYYFDVMHELEQQTTARTVMVRWEKGVVESEAHAAFPYPIAWGWFSRTSEPGTNLVELNKRVASVITWSHDNISNNEIFATAGCSMGTNATFGPVLWHGLDPIIDYQVLVGGPNMWDLNAQCGLRTYDSGFCDMDGVTTCSTDSDCSTVDENSQCVWSEMYPTIPVAFKSMPDHVHATNTCRVEPAAPGEVEPYAPFDESSMGYSAQSNWQITHPIDLIVNIGGEQGEPVFDFAAGTGGGDEFWELGAFPFVFNQIETTAGKRWHVEPGQHCDGMFSANNLLIERLGL